MKFAGPLEAAILQLSLMFNTQLSDCCLSFEVHTPKECEKALEYGANCIVVNQWDRITGELYPKQV